LADATRERALASLAKLVLNLRLVAVLLTVLWIPYAEGGDLRTFSVALVVAALLTLWPLLAWDRLGGLLMRHPATLATDLVLAVGILAVMGPDSPFFLYTLGTALLAGVLYGRAGAAIFSGLLLAGYASAVLLRVPAVGVPLGFPELVGLPALYPLAAAGAAAIRRLLLRERAMAETLDDRERTAAVADERARLAREMHDSLAKTLHGIALSATALPRWVERDPVRAARSAEQLATAAERAAAEARELIGDLRSDRLDLPLGQAVRRCLDEWGERTGVAVSADLADVGTVAPEARYEVFCILREALRNVERHAGADGVRVQLLRAGDEMTLSVRDDGRGFEPDTDTLTAGARYGLVGMAERARRVGGRCRVEAAPGQGTHVLCTVPCDGQPPAIVRLPTEVAP
jgi:signal transduction histidine kinase